jgi:NAD(P)-dependent dehydrogenase (short-subunit alcohol dehydrogenase family)
MNIEWEAVMGTVLVTGGANGIGKAIARRLVSDNCLVIVLDTDTRAGRETLRDLNLLGHGDFIRVDVSSEGSVRKGFEGILKRHGPIDAIVNNAGITDINMGPVGKLDIRQWHRIMDVNLTSVVLTAKYGYPHFREGKGSIVNIASTRFLQSEPDTFAYSASKGGMISLTHSLAISLGPGIRVNCISPGWIHTGPGDLRPEDHRQHPCGRVGMPEDIASLTAFLISEKAGFITVQNYIIDGGMTRKMIYEE